jgi:carbon-monoxide dehydrogenase small subunit
LDSKQPFVRISFTLNGKPVELDAPPWESALSVIRDRLGLTGPKEGCGIGECGACTILVDGKAINSCLMPALQLDSRDVLTIEGLAESATSHGLPERFLEMGATQCGFCSPGMLMSAKSLLDKNPNPTRSEILEALSGNLCRCTGYVQIIEAVEAAAEEYEK